MSALSRINGIGTSSLELLEAVGISNAEELAIQDADSLVQELERVIEVLAINRRAPGKATVAKWVASAIGLTEGTLGQDEAQPEPDLRRPVNYEANPEVAEMLSRAPFAIPLPGRIMMEKGLAVADVAAGLLLNRYSGELEVRVDGLPDSDPVLSARRPPGNLETIEMKDGRRHFEASSAKRMTPSPGNGKKMPKSRAVGKEDRISQIRAPGEQTNLGKDPESRNFVRGVLHIHPWRLRSGAIFSLMLMVNMPLAIAAALFLLLSREYPGTFPWVPEWLLAFPAALPLIGLGWLIWAQPVKCRICSQKLFVHSRAFKHVKAHRLPGMGYVVPLCLHLLMYRWFRCSSCGTPIRLKK